MPLTKKGLAYLSIAYAFIAFAVAFREFYLAAFVLPISFLILTSASLSKMDVSRIRVQRKLTPSRSFGGEPVDVLVNVANDAACSLPEFEIEDRVQTPLTVENELNLVPLSLGPEETVEWTYRISAASRGHYSLGPISIRHADILGFHRRQEQILLNDSFTVSPQVEKIGTIDLKAKRVGPWPGQVPYRRVGVGTEFYELRMYNAGDELKRINWKASARIGSLVTNEFESEHVTDVLVVLDSTEGAISSLFDFDLLEFQLSLAASLCSQFLLQGNRVGLAIYGSVRAWVDPAFGKRQLLKILDNLAMVKAGRALVPMDYAVRSVVESLVPSKSMIVFISPLLNDEIADVISNLSLRGYISLCLSPVLMSVQGKDPSALAKRILSLQRRANAIRVATLATLIEFSPQMSLKSSLKRGIRLG